MGSPKSGGSRLGNLFCQAVSLLGEAVTNDLRLSAWPMSAPDMAVLNLGGKVCQQSRRTIPFCHLGLVETQPGSHQRPGIRIIPLTPKFGGKVCQHRPPWFALTCLPGFTGPSPKSMVATNFSFGRSTFIGIVIRRRGQSGRGHWRSTRPCSAPCSLHSQLHSSAELQQAPSSCITPSIHCTCVRHPGHLSRVLGSCPECRFTIVDEWGGRKNLQITSASWQSQEAATNDLLFPSRIYEEFVFRCLRWSFVPLIHVTVKPPLLTLHLYSLWTQFSQIAHSTTIMATHPHHLNSPRLPTECLWRSSHRQGAQGQSWYTFELLASSSQPI